MGLERYRKKRDFSRTPEPAGTPRPRRKQRGELEFVVQKHAASRLHYDFRLEMDGVLKSWAVPKGPSLDPHEKRLAVEVEDHPIEYGGFEGIIPAGEYGGGTVLLWDRGTWSSLEGDPVEAHRQGKIKFELQGEKLRGGWTLVRMHGPRAGDNHENWLLIKEKDETARPGSGDEVVREQVASVESGQTIEEIAADPPRVWRSNRAAEAGEESGRGAKPAGGFKARLQEIARRAAAAATAKTGGAGRKARAGGAGGKAGAAGAGGKAGAGGAKRKRSRATATSVAGRAARSSRKPAPAAGDKASAAEAGGAAAGAKGEAAAKKSATGGKREAAASSRSAPAGKAVRAARKPGSRSNPGGAVAELAGALPGARRAPMPREVTPELATLVTAPPGGDHWLHEIKFDGYRVLCEMRRGKARLLTRHGKDWTDRFTPVAEAVAALPVESAILDGEVTVLLPDGKTSFQALQESLGDGGPAMVYFAFDLLYLEGHDLRGAHLASRKDLLRQLLEAAGVTAGEGPLRWSDHVAGRGEDFYRQACAHGLEGIVSKRSDLPYRPGRGKDWVKVKCLQRQEMVIGGFTDPAGARGGLGALLLGVYEGARLVYAGKVGTGFTARTLLDLRRRLDPLERPAPPFANPPRGADARGAHWVEPRLVCEVAFTEWTRDGNLRHPTFQGLREDKDPREVRRELPVTPPGPPSKSAGGPPSAAAASQIRAAIPSLGGGGAGAATMVRRVGAKSKAAAADGDGAWPPAGQPAGAGSVIKAPSGRGAVEVAGVRLTHPERVLFPGVGLTKRDLALYYERIADWILPHIADRPLTLVRCPEGQAGECFYQKHVTDQFHDSVRRVPVEEGGKTVPYGAIDSVAGLVALVQMSVLELHIWGSHRDQIERPDYAVFDLDPDEGLAWERVVEAALELRQLLADAGLRTFLKTTGGKGLHVVLPLTRRHTWDEVKGFTRAVTEAMVAAAPDRYTSNLLKARRKGRIFIDYLRNGRGATSIAAYSCRARPGAPVSAPLDWEELGTAVRANTYTVETLPARLEALAADPWSELGSVKQSITAAMKRRFGFTD